VTAVPQTTEKLRIGLPQQPGESAEEAAARLSRELNTSLGQARKMVAIQNGTYKGDFQKFDSDGVTIRSKPRQYWRDPEFMAQVDALAAGEAGPPEAVPDVRARTKFD